MISDSILESDEEENEEESENKRGRPLAKLCILKNAHIPETGEWLLNYTCGLLIYAQFGLCISYDGPFLPPRAATLLGR